MLDRRALQVGAAAGILFVALVIVTLIVLLPDSPSDSSTVQEVNDYFDDSGRHNTNLVLSVPIGFFFLWFLGTLRSLMRPAEGEPGRLTSIATIGGVVLLALSLAATALQSGYGSALDFFDNMTPDPRLGFLSFSLSFWCFAYAGVGAAALLAGVAGVVLRSGLFPRWFAWFSLVVGALQLLTFLFPPITVLFLLWVVIVSVLLWTRGSAAPAVARAT